MEGEPQPQPRRGAPATEAGHFATPLDVPRIEAAGDLAGGADSRLGIVVTSVAAARNRLGRWHESDPPARAIVSVPGLVARERVVCTGPRSAEPRRERIAIAQSGARAVVGRWSTSEPVSADDERAWVRLLGRISAIQLRARTPATEAGAG